jgi:hypothetical protein
LRGTRDGETEIVRGRIRMVAPAPRVRARIPTRYADVEPDGPDACIVTSRGTWSPGFLVWMATLDEPMEVLDPPEMVQAARTVVARLAAGPAG